MSDFFISINQAESDLLACAAYLAERIKSRDGHAEAMNTIVPMYLAKGDVDLAAELSNAVDDPYSRDKLLTSVAVKCAEVDDEEYAMQLAEAIEDHGLQSQAFERIGLTLAGKGRSERAAEIADRLGHPDFVYAGIAVNHSAAGDSAAADDSLDTIEFPTARVHALQHMASAKIDAGELDLGLEMLRSASVEADEIEHDEERLRALIEIGNAFIAAKANDAAIETFDKAKTLAESLDNQHRDFFLVSSALGFLHAGSVELADRTLDLVRDKTQMASAMLGFARDQWAKSEKDDAVDSLEEAYAILKSQRENETRDSRARNALFTTIATQFAGFGKSERATEISIENPDPSEQMKGLAQIAQILTIQKEDELARDTLNQIGEDSDRLFALVAMADAKAKLEEPDAAAAILDEAATLAETVPQLSARSDALNEIADRYVRLGQPDKARSAALENLEVIGLIKDEASRAAALASLAEIYSAAGLEVEDAERTALRGLANRIAF